MLTLTLLVTIGLAGFTAATPFTTIPLGRNTLARNDGTFDAVKAMRSAFRTKSKHEQNLRNFQRNVLGVALPGDVCSFFYNSDPRLDRYFQNAVTSVAHSSRSKTGSEPLTDFNRSRWPGLTSVGEPSQSFEILFDTGSSDFWVPSTNCTDLFCSTRPKYDPTKSTASKLKPGRFFIEYGDNPNVTVQGPIYTDTVSIAGIQVTEQYLSAASVVSPLFAHDPEDG